MKPLLRWITLALLAGLALQLYFAARIALMAVADPQSTAFQRSEALRLARSGDIGRWRQEWVPYTQLPNTLKRAVIASEDSGFANHDGVDWTAVEKAWQTNAAAQEQAEERAYRGSRRARAGNRPPRIRGGSTITQQLAKNLFLSGERTMLRKGQELVVTVLLETLLSKRRILELYLNSVEWGEGIFGAEAAAQRYFRKPAARLTAYEAARLAVMLPRPKYFERLPQSAYVAGRARTIQARIAAAEAP
ncbi:monofunctional biosynthetic peptidoglycan transglycosylase [Xylophilus sp.]|uniref:monofunctional biosynthetic peptidoglycan transglycosylase n=1 Tax=Xylophilus sp. TaxID=2653893 RepID=UPI0013B6A177|nr:monofunctional biosynthetic peptidoglycan transglycosylase [Xylophilus sp.]KAF1046399.1 MAG: Biosynthetic peptidoglycan transglycosylase [Xylophilus sp.]